MKKIFIAIVGISLVAISCKKESNIEVVTEPSVHSISATFEETKATYSDAGIFSWESGDQISYVVRSTTGSSPTNKFNFYPYTTSNSGSSASFSGSAPSGEWTAYDYAFYPYVYDGSKYYNRLFIPAATTLQAMLAGTIEAATDRFSGIIPMIGKKTGTDASGKVENYHFYPVTGVLKVSFTGLPSNATQIRLDMPDNATYPLNGTFNVDTSREIPEIKASDCDGTKWGQKYINFTYASSTDAFYFPIPTGTIPAGKLKVSVADGTNVLYSVTCTTDLVLTRGEITEVPNISIPSVSIKFTGTHSAYVYFSGDVKKVSWTTAQNSGYTSRENQTNYVTTSGTEITLGDSYYNGIRYFGYSAYNDAEATRESDDSKVIETHSGIPYYDPSLSATVVGTYTWNQTATESGKTSSVFRKSSTIGMSLSTSPSITFEVSDNIKKGNIMITELSGKATRKIYAFYKDNSTDVVFLKENQPLFIENGVKYWLTEGGSNTDKARFRIGGGVVYGATTTPDLYCQGAYLNLWYGDSYDINNVVYQVSYFLANKQ